jgi:4-hydroxybenzoate polyprenyltransferase
MRSPIIQLLRPHQWTKNAFCLAGLFFSGRASATEAIIAALWVTLVFCLASSATYVLNDLVDLERDRQHPRKRRRPLPSGRISTGGAWALLIVLIVATVLSCTRLSTPVWICVLVYFAVSTSYTVVFKHRPLYDVMAIALGFVLRLLAGVLAVDVKPTAWITLCTFFLALFLGFAKRRAELVTSISEKRHHRPVLRLYTPQLLDSFVDASAVMAVMSYSLFTILSNKNPSLVLTVPIVVFGVFRYRMASLRGSDAEEPEKLVFHDRGLQACTAAWLLVYFIVLYFGIEIFI